jgi:hypothetical protein
MARGRILRRGGSSGISGIDVNGSRSGSEHEERIHAPAATCLNIERIITLYMTNDKRGAASHIGYIECTLTSRLLRLFDSA